MAGKAQSFQELGVPDHLVSALNAAGWRRPSPVQQASIPLGMAGSDLIVQAKSGTGKTVAFSTMLLERVSVASPQPQVLVLAPTREIALQSAEVINTVGAHMAAPGLSVGVFIGGLPAEEDRKLLRRPHKRDHVMRCCTRVDAVYWPHTAVQSHLLSDLKHGDKVRPLQGLLSQLSC